MIRRFLLACALVLAGISAGRAEQVKIIVDVVPQTPAHVIDRSKSVAELTAGRPHSGRDTQGLTTVEFTYGYTLVDPKAVKNVKGICMQGDVHLQVRVGFKPPVVAIGRELDPTKCHYHAAVGHELKHVGAAFETVGVLTAKAQRLFAVAASKFARVCAPDLGALKAHIGRQMGVALAALKQVAEEDNRARNAVIDSADEYARTHAICTVR